jgi:hypothetical protein
VLGFFGQGYGAQTVRAVKIELRLAQRRNRFQMRRDRRHIAHETGPGIPSAILVVSTESSVPRIIGMRALITSSLRAPQPRQIAAVWP